MKACAPILPLLLAACGEMPKSLVEQTADEAARNAAAAEEAELERIRSDLRNVADIQRQAREIYEESQSWGAGAPPGNGAAGDE